MIARNENSEIPLNNTKEEVIKQTLQFLEEHIMQKDDEGERDGGRYRELMDKTVYWVFCFFSALSDRCYETAMKVIEAKEDVVYKILKRCNVVFTFSVD